jgi:hypothetical protein
MTGTDLPSTSATPPGDSPPFLTSLRTFTRNLIRRSRATVRWGLLAEVVLILVWAAWVGRPFLDFDPFAWPSGIEFGFQFQSHHFWNQLRSCGLCALWNGTINGGHPALAESYGSPLHPLVMITTLLWGTIVGGKVTVVTALALAGLAQWWIARRLGLGTVARLWTSLVAVAGGHLAGRLELPAIGMVLSTAMGSLTVAAALDLGLTGRRRAAVLLAVMLALTLVSGQGYIQVALLGWVPLLLIFVLDKRLRLRPNTLEFVLAAGVALLLAGVLLVPLAHFLPGFAKHGDPLFGTAQPLEYVPLNLVIRDIDFLKGTMLGKLPFPYLYDNYIGWVPVLLAIASLLFARKADGRALAFLGGGIALTFLLVSAVPFRWLVHSLPRLAEIRHTPLMAGLAVPAVLGLAGYGLDGLLKLAWPQFALRWQSAPEDRGLNLSMAWILVIPLLFGLRAVFQHARSWIYTRDNERVYQAAAAWESTALEWVSPPFGEHAWVEAASTLGIKLTNVVWPWDWEGRTYPLPRLEATRGNVPPDTELLATADGVSTFLHPDQHYAYVDLDGRVIPCEATGSGGDLSVRCTTDRPGELTVQENAWTGWRARQDDQPVELLPGSWLRTQAPAGEHVYRFRYLPWDVPVGLALTLAGVALAVLLWVKAKPHTMPQDPLER